MLDAEGAEISSGGFDDVIVTREGTNHLNVQMMNNFKLEMNGIEAMQAVAEFLKNAKLQL